MKPLSPTDQLFLWLEKRHQPMHVAGLQLFSFPEGAPDDYVGELAAAMRQYTQVSAPLNQRLGTRYGRYYWKEDESLDLEHHFRHEALPRPGRVRELLARVSAEHGYALDRERPLWQCHLIEGLQERRFALYTKVHHSLVDGISAMRMAQKALSTDPHARDLPPAWALPSVESSGSAHRPMDVLGSLAHLLAGAGEQLSTIPKVVQELYKTIRRARREQYYDSAFQAPPCLLNQKITGARRFAAQSYSLSRIRAIGEAFGTTVNDVVLAMCSSALRAYLLSQNALPDAPLIAMVPMSLRQDESAGGNQLGMILTNLATDLADPAMRLMAIQDSVRQSKERYASMTPAEILNYTALTLAPAGLHLLTGLAPRWQTFNVIISNVPGPKEPLYWNGARLEGMYPVSIVLDRMALNMTLTSYCDQIEFGLVGCLRTLPSLQRLLDYLEAGLVELEEAAGIQPG